MIPTLLVKDYILVSKFSYGLRIPFTKKWFWGPRTPQRGDVVVFRSQEDDYYFMVKRVVGLPGDKIVVGRKGERLVVNDTPILQMKKTEMLDEGFDSFQETLGDVEHLVQYEFVGNNLSSNDWESDQEREFIVPDGQLFLMGDNRDRSSDSRVWGTLPMTNLLGKAQWIWMSCKEDSPAASVFCIGEDMRQERVFTKIK
jgi:signal peptidase I